MAIKIKTSSGTVTIKSPSTKKNKGAPRSKRTGANNGPARQRYWTSGRLREKKVKALMRHNGLTRAQAEVHWENARQGHRTRWAARV